MQAGHEHASGAVQRLQQRSRTRGHAHARRVVVVVRLEHWHRSEAHVRTRLAHRCSIVARTSAIAQRYGLGLEVAQVALDQQKLLVQHALRAKLIDALGGTQQERATAA
eukprot:6922110-Prymnesium_polylepis.1